MRRALVGLSLLAGPAVAPLHAQTVTATAVARTALEARAHGLTTVTQTLPAGTALQGRVAIMALAPASHSGSVGPAQFVADLAQEPRSFVRYTLTDYSTTGSSMVGGSSSTGPHETLLGLTASHPVTARLLLRYSRNSLPNTFAGIDLLDDGTIDWQSSPFQNVFVAGITVQLGPTPFPIRTITASAVASTVPLTVSQVLELEILPLARCTAASFAQGCGPTLTAADNWLAGVGFDVGGLPARAGDPVLLVLGRQAATTPLPLPPGCALATDVVAVLWSASTATGGARFDLDGRAAPGPVAFRAQAVHLDVPAWQVRTSGALLVSCR